MTASNRWTCDACGTAVDMHPEADEMSRAAARSGWLEVVSTLQSPHPHIEPDSTGILHYCPTCAAKFRDHVRPFTRRA